MIYLELFLVFFSIGLFTFGGGYAMVPILKVEVLERGWMNQQLFIDFISISESTPGPLALNMATFIGTETGGIAGALVASFAMMLPSIIIITLIAALFHKTLKHPLFQAALAMIKPVIIALIGTTILFLLKNLLFPLDVTNNHATFDVRHFSLLINLATLYFGSQAIRKRPLHPMLLIGVAACFGILIFSF